MNIAIIMPYYNEKDLLVKSVDGINKQTYRDWHLFIVDDGSKEENKAEHFVKLDPSKFTIIYKENDGVSSARNTAIDLIKNDQNYRYVAYCDSDDIWDETYLERQIDAIFGLDMVYSSVRHRFVNGNVAVPYGISDPRIYPGLLELLKGNFIFISGVVHRRDCLSVGYFDEELNSIEDWDFWARIAEAGYSITKNPKACFSYTVKQDGNGSKSNKEVYDKFYQKHSKYM